MSDLYLETTAGKTPIDDETAQKYHLEAGMQSPFTKRKIVGQNGDSQSAEDADSEASIRRDFNNMPFQGIEGDGVDQMDNGFQFSQSEIIDFSQGVDSRMDENR